MINGDIIQQYSFKKGSSPDTGRIKSALVNNFPAEIKEENGKYTISYGAFKRFTVWLDKKLMIVDSESNKEAKDDIIMDTNKRYRVFLEEVTGYTAKERLKKAKKEVQGD